MLHLHDMLPPSHLVNGMDCTSLQAEKVLRRTLEEHVLRPQQGVDAICGEAWHEGHNTGSSNNVSLANNCFHTLS